MTVSSFNNNLSNKFIISILKYSDKLPNYFANVKITSSKSHFYAYLSKKFKISFFLFKGFFNE